MKTPIDIDLDTDKVYLNNASTSFPKSHVAFNSFIKAVQKFPSGSRQNLIESDLLKCREQVGSVLDVPPESVFFTSGATLGINQVINGFMTENSCFVIDNRSHNAVIRPWSAWKERADCKVAFLYDENDNFDELALKEALKLSPKLICLSHINNVNGSIYPIEKIISLIKSTSKDTSIMIDASQSAGAVPLRGINGADFIVFPSHKHLHSFPGAAVVIASKPLKPWVLGGTGSHSSSNKTGSELDYFVEVGTCNYPAIQALCDSLIYAESKFSNHHSHEKQLIQRFIEGVQKIEGLSVLGRSINSERIGIVALVPKYGLSEIHWAPFLRSQNVYTRGGIHCSPLYHEQLQLLQKGSLRFSFGWNTSLDDIEKALRALKEFSLYAKDLLS